MNEDAGLKLLAAIEALSAEIRGMRSEMTDEREARGLLNARRERDRRRKSELRPRKSEEVSAEIRGTVQVVSIDQDLDHDQTKDLPLPRKIRGQTAAPRTTGAVWLAYSAGYRKVYGAEPVRNAKVNGQITQLLKRLPESDAAEVAAFYLTHRASRYSQVGHSVGMLLFDAEKLHTEWMTGRKVTATEARQVDKTQANVDGWMQTAEEFKRGLVK